MSLFDSSELVLMIGYIKVYWWNGQNLFWFQKNAEVFNNSTKYNAPMAFATIKSCLLKHFTCFWSCRYLLYGCWLCLPFGCLHRNYVLRQCTCTVTYIRHQLQMIVLIINCFFPSPMQQDRLRKWHLCHLEATTDECLEWFKEERLRETKDS